MFWLSSNYFGNGNANSAVFPDHFELLHAFLRLIEPELRSFFFDSPIKLIARVYMFWLSSNYFGNGNANSAVFPDHFELLHAFLRLIEPELRSFFFDSPIKLIAWVYIVWPIFIYFESVNANKNLFIK